MSDKKMRDVFKLPINHFHVVVDSDAVKWEWRDGLTPHELACEAINQHDTLVDRVKVLEEALNLARCDIKMLSSLKVLQNGNPVEYIDKALEADNG